MLPLSRRRFALMAGTAGVAATGLAVAEPLTAEAVIRRIQKELGGDWPSTGPDGFKAGDPVTVVKGIATTAMATVSVLMEAVKANTNLVLPTSRPFIAGGRPGACGTHAGGPGGIGRRSRDQSQTRIHREERSCGLRLRDHWQARKENDMVAGLAAALGWSMGRVKNDDALYDIAPATAEATVTLIRSKLNFRGGLRAVGDRKATVRECCCFPAR